MTDLWNTSLLQYKKHSKTFLRIYIYNVNPFFFRTKYQSVFTAESMGLISMERAIYSAAKVGHLKAYCIPGALHCRLRLWLYRLHEVSDKKCVSILALQIPFKWPLYFWHYYINTCKTDRLLILGTRPTRQVRLAPKIPRA